MEERSPDVDAGEGATRGLAGEPGGMTKRGEETDLLKPKKPFFSSVIQTLRTVSSLCVDASTLLNVLEGVLTRPLTDDEASSSPPLYLSVDTLCIDVSDSIQVACALIINLSQVPCELFLPKPLAFGSALKHF